MRSDLEAEITLAVQRYRYRTITHRIIHCTRYISDVTLMFTPIAAMLYVQCNGGSGPTLSMRSKLTQLR